MAHLNLEGCQVFHENVAQLLSREQIRLRLHGCMLWHERNLWELHNLPKKEMKKQKISNTRFFHSFSHELDGDVATKGFVDFLFAFFLS